MSNRRNRTYVPSKRIKSMWRKVGRPGSLKDFVANSELCSGPLWNDWIKNKSR